MAVSKSRKVLRFVLVLMLVGISGLGALGWYRSQPENMWARAQAAREAGMYEAARLTLLNLVQKVPDHAAGHRALADVLVEEARQEHPEASYATYPAALEHLAKAWETGPDNLDTGRLLLSVYVEMGRRRDAVPVAAALLEKEPENVEALFVQAWDAVERRNAAEAEATFARLAEVRGEPDYRTLLLQHRHFRGAENREKADAVLAQVLERLEDAGELSPADARSADELLVQAVTHAPDAAEAERRMSAGLDVQERRAERGEAAEAGRAALRLARTLSERHSTPGDGVRRPALLGRVVALGRPAAEADALSLAQHRELAVIAFLAEEDEAGLWVLRRAIEQLKGRRNGAREALDFHLLAARQLVGRQRFRSAEEHVAALLADPSSAGWGHLLAGNIALGEGRLEAALPHLEQARRSLGSTLMVRFALARVLTGLKRWNEALPYLASLHVDPDKLNAEERAWAKQFLNPDTVHLLEAQARLALGDAQRAEGHLRAIRGPAQQSQAVALQAMWHWNRNERSEVLRLIEQGRRRFPADSTLARMEVVALMQSGDLQKAGERIAELATFDPDDLPVQILLYRWLTASGRHQEGLEHLDRLLEKFPQETGLLVVKAQGLLAAGDAAGAMEVSEKLRANPQTEDAGNLVGALAALKLHDLQGAAEALEATADSERRFGGVGLLQADMELARGNHRAAIDALSGSMQFTGLRGGASRGLVQALLQLATQESASAAEARLDQLLEEYPNEVLLVLTKVDLQIRQANFAGAAQSLDRLATLQSRSAVAPLLKARLWWGVGRREEALQELDTAIETEPRQVAGHLLAVSYCLEMGRAGDALNYAVTGLKVHSTSAELALLRARALRDLKRTREAEEALGAIRKARPELPQPWIELASLHAAARPDEAVRVLAEGREALPGNEALIQASIALLCQLNRLDEAGALADTVAAERPASPTALLLGRSFAVAGQRGLARQWGQRALELAEEGQRTAARLLLGDLALAEGQADPAASEKLAEARDHFAAVLEHDPAHLVAGNNLAWLLATHFDDVGEAERVAAAVRGRVPLRQAPPAFADTLLTVYRRAGRWDEVRKLVDEAVAAWPTEMRWLLAKVELAVEQGHFDQAVRDLDRVQAAQRWLPGPAYAKARLWSSLKHPQRALTAARQALEIDPDHLPSRLLALDLALQTADYSAVLEHAAHALRQDSGLWDVYRQQSEALTALGRDGEAVEALAAGVRRVESAISESGGQPMHYAALVALHRAAGQSEQALATLESGRERFPDDRLLMHESVRTLLTLGRHDEAERLADEALGEAADVPVSLALGRTFYAERHMDAARRWGQLALERGTDDERMTAHWLLGDVALAEGERTGERAHFEAAREHYEAVLTRQPRHLATGNNLAWVLVNHLDEPLRALEVAEQVRGGASVGQLHVSFVDTLGRVYRMADRLPEARRLLEEAAALHPTQPGLQFELGLVYLASSQAAAGRRALNTALRLGLDGAQAEEARQALSGIEGETGGP